MTLGAVLEILLSGFQNNRNIRANLEICERRSSRSLKQRVWGMQPSSTCRVTLFLKSKNYANHEVYITHVYITATISVK